MISMGMKSLTDIRDDIEVRLNEKYETKFEVNGKKCFYFNGFFFVISAFKWKDGDNILVVEYEESSDRAQKGLFGEDGDMFYPEEMTEEELFQAIVREIED